MNSSLSTPNMSKDDQGGCLALTDWGLIRASGEDAAKFLHSQLTQDFALLDLAHARLAGYCSAKGRLLATLVGWKLSDEELLLALPVERVAPTLKRLSMFVLRSKCKLSEASDAWRLYGLAGTVAHSWLKAQGYEMPAAPWDLLRLGGDGGATLVRLPDGAGVPRFLLTQSAQAAAPDLPALDARQWQTWDVQSGLAWVQGATVEQFVPQMLNLELLGGVSFQKGCYPGQEVVARSQYRGTVKRRTFLFETDGAAQIGQELFHSADPEQPAGMVAAAAASPVGEAGSVVLAEVKLAALEAGSLHLGSPQGPQLRPQPMPYAVGEPQ
ncbi:MAG: folate-binding protein YgfZ [Burkholderiaceae bacterium]|nr:folate-binding protein YgfZ [Roseateles sp.]MBV8471519.1 folate-binding protein YgfZ [Burkholderiaceae bacterium]